MLSWLKKANPSLKPPSLPGLPNPADTANPLDTAAANAEVEKAMQQASRKRKRGGNNHYSPEVRAKIAKLCIEIGPQKAAKKMTQELGRDVNESTVRSIKKAFQKEVVRQGTNNIANLPHKNVGRPLMLGDLDAAVQEFVRSTRQAGGVVNRVMVMAAAKGIVLRRDRSLLTEYGGHIDIKKAWANSLLTRMNFVRRKGTKAARKLPAEFEDTKEAFLARIAEAVAELDIPDDMVINWDQTGVNIVPVGDWTLEEAGARQVPVIGLEDKRQITLLLAISLSGTLLPPQVLYQGKTDACHARFDFPEEWDVFHTASHWSTADSMERYVDNVVAPYMSAQRERLGLDDDHPGLAIFDVYKAHRTPGLLAKLRENNIRPVFVPASCTGELQPLDSDGCINDALKKDLTQSFTNYYAEKVAKALENGDNIENVKVDLRLSAIKPLHANWLLGAMDRLAAKSDVIGRGWERTGIRDAIQKVFQDVRRSPSARTLESLAIEHSRNIIDTREKYESLLQKEREESTNQMAGMQEELEVLRQSQMKKTHCDTCTSPIQIEGKSVSVDQEVKIQDMASRHKKEVSQLRDVHQKELDQLKTQLQMSQDDLQRRNKESVAEVDQLTELIETLKLQHEEEVRGLREALAREIDSTREEVARSFQKTVASVGCSTDEDAEFVSSDVLRERLEELEQEWEEKLAAAKQAHEDDLEQVRNDMLTAVRFAQEAAKTDQESEELRKRVQELEEEIHQVEAEYEEALRRQKEEFERALHRTQAGVPGKEQASKKYEEELDSIRAVSDQALSSLEDSHQRMLEDMKRSHQRELEKVEEQKEMLLAEETAATIAAIEAMKKAHRDELVREVAKARMEAGQTSQDLEAIRQEHQKEIEALNREVEVLSKQFSAKCVEKSHLDQQVETQAVTIKEVQSKLQDLMQQNQELSARLTEEMKRVQRLESGGTREPSDGKDTPNLYELQVSLRVKQSELQYLRQEVGSLKEELKSARRDQMHLAEKHQRLQLEYEGLRVRHDRQVASLRSQLDDLQEDDPIVTASKNLPEVVPEEQPVAMATPVRYSPSPGGSSSSRYTSTATSSSAYDIQRSKSTPDFLTLPEAGSTTERHFSDDMEPTHVKLRRSKSLERGPRSGRVADRLRLFETP